jgi:hypothetical protein
MTQPESSSARLPVSGEVARIVTPEAPRAVQLAAARGALPLSPADLLTALAFLCTNPDAEVRSTALRTLRDLPTATLLPPVANPALHPRLLDLLVRVRMADRALMAAVIAHPAVSAGTLLLLAARGDRDLLSCLASQQERLDAEILAALRSNPHADQLIRDALGEAPDAAAQRPEVALDEAEAAEEFPPAIDGDPAEVEEVSDEQIADLLREAEAKGVSKYQLALELKVAERIKLAMTGDKEWRKILVKDPNKLVHGAVLRNGRVTEGEVLMVAKNRTSSDELVRLILLNRDWLKHYEIRKALVAHPKTPLAKALRFVSELSLRDLKELARSRNVANVIAVAARKELTRKMQRGG